MQTESLALPDVLDSILHTLWSCCESMGLTARSQDSGESGSTYIVFEHFCLENQVSCVTVHYNTPMCRKADLKYPLTD